MVTTARKGRADIMTRMVSEYGFFVLEVLKAWIDPSRKRPRTIHHLGRGRFMVSGRTIRIASRAK
jgi:hypothetical protein